MLFSATVGELSMRSFPRETRRPGTWVFDRSSARRVLASGLHCRGAADFTWTTTTHLGLSLASVNGSLYLYNEAAFREAGDFIRRRHRNATIVGHDPKDRTVVEDTVDLRAADIGGDLQAPMSHLGDVDARGLRVRGSWSTAHKHQRIEETSSRFTRVRADLSHVGGNLDFRGLVIDGDPVAGTPSLDLSRSVVDGAVMFSASDVTDTVSSVLRCEGQIQLSGMTSSHLCLSGDCQDPRGWNGTPLRGRSPVLDWVQVASFNILCKPKQRLGSSIRIDLERARLQRLSVIPKRASTPRGDVAAPRTFTDYPVGLDLSGASIERWSLHLEESANSGSIPTVNGHFKPLLEGLTNFDRGAYVAIEAYFRARGDVREADQMLRLRRDVEQALEDSWTQTMFSALHRLIGYGSNLGGVLLFWLVLALTTLLMARGAIAPGWIAVEEATPVTDALPTPARNREPTDDAKKTREGESTRTDASTDHSESVSANATVDWREVSEPNRWAAAVVVASELSFPFVNEFLRNEAYRLSPKQPGRARFLVIVNFALWTLIFVGAIPRVFGSKV